MKEKVKFHLTARLVRDYTKYENVQERQLIRIGQEMHDTIMTAAADNGADHCFFDVGDYKPEVVSTAIDVLESKGFVVGAVAPVGSRKYISIRWSKG